VSGLEILGLMMMLAMISIIFVGFPIAFTLLFIALLFGSIG
jgi:TRAP-type mannitol/chloroaromatic compound transport system permease large subunit